MALVPMSACSMPSGDCRELANAPRRPACWIAALSTPTRAAERLHAAPAWPRARRPRQRLASPKMRRSSYRGPSKAPRYNRQIATPSPISPTTFGRHTKIIAGETASFVTIAFAHVRLVHAARPIRARWPTTLLKYSCSASVLRSAPRSCRGRPQLPARQQPVGC